MSVQYALRSHGTLLGYTGAALPCDELPADASLWHLVPTRAFDLIEPIVAELTAPPALALVRDVIPTQDAYLHPSRREHEAQMERLMHEAVRIHHFRLVLERYEALELELCDAAGRRVQTTTLIVTKQMVSPDAAHAWLDREDPRAAYEADAAESCYLVMARVANASASAASAASAA